MTFDIVFVKVLFHQGEGKAKALNKADTAECVASMGSKVGWEASKDMLPDLVIYLDCPRAVIILNKRKGRSAFCIILDSALKIQKGLGRNKKVWGELYTYNA